MPYLPSLARPFGAKRFDAGVDRKSLAGMLFRRTDMSEHGVERGHIRCQVEFTTMWPADPVVRCEINVDGVIDISTAPKLRDLLVNTIDNGTLHLTVDIDDVEFLDASGLGVLVGASKRIRAGGGSLKLICSNQRLLQIFQITGLAKAFGLPTSIRAPIVTPAPKAHDREGRLPSDPSRSAIC